MNMSTVHYAPFLAVILILQSYSVTSDFLSPLFGDVCQENVCGKGNCVKSNNSTFGFECECEGGWKQARSDDDDNLKFLPCIVPNCTLHFNCAKAPSPPPNNDQRANFSFFDPCFWTDCGGGTCNKTSLFTHACECEEGYYNLFNTTAFPCYRQCALGMDCANLGLRLPNMSTSSPDSSPSSANVGTSHSEITSLKYAWLITMVTTLALALWKDA